MISSYAPRYASPLSSPSLSASGSSSAGAFPAPSVAMSASSSTSSYGGADYQRTALGPSSSARRSSSPCFPRSQPLRPLSSGLCMSSLSSPALRRKSDGAALEPRPINHMMQPSRGNGKKVKMLVSSKKMVRPQSIPLAGPKQVADRFRLLQNCFELNLSGRELARVE